MALSWGTKRQTSNLLRTCSGTLINSFRFGNQAQGFLDSHLQLLLIALCIPAIVQDLDVGFNSHALQAFAVDGAVGSGDIKGTVLVDILETARYHITGCALSHQGGPPGFLQCVSQKLFAAPAA